MMNITMSFLPTKDDYVNFVSCVLKNEISRKDKLVSYILGIVVGLFGVSEIIFKDISSGIIFLSICVLIFLYFSYIYPQYEKAKAASYFEYNREKMYSMSYIFTDDGLKIISDRYNLCCPYEFLYKIEDDQNTLLIYTGKGEINYIPKRIIEKDDYVKITNIKEKIKNI